MSHDVGRLQGPGIEWLCAFRHDDVHMWLSAFIRALNAFRESSRMMALGLCFRLGQRLLRDFAHPVGHAVLVGGILARPHHIEVARIKPRTGGDARHSEYSFEQRQVRATFDDPDDNALFSSSAEG